MLSVEKVRGVARVQLHWLEALMLLQYSTGPLPNTTQVRLAAELIAPLSHRDGMPVLEPHIGPFKINEEIVRGKGKTSTCIRAAIHKMHCWWGLIDAVVAEVSVAD